MSASAESDTVQVGAFFPKEQEWFVFSRESLHQLLVDLDVNVQEAMPDIYNHEAATTAVIDLHMAWAGPALHMVAQAIAIAKHTAFDADQAAALQAQADYYHEAAIAADNGRMDLPGGE